VGSKTFQSQYLLPSKYMSASSGKASMGHLLGIGRYYIGLAAVGDNELVADL
jgi:hypothetical protein